MGTITIVRYAGVTTEHAMERERMNVDALLHDNVICPNNRRRPHRRETKATGTADTERRTSEPPSAWV